MEEEYRIHKAKEDNRKSTIPDVNALNEKLNDTSIQNPKPAQVATKEEATTTTTTTATAATAAAESETVDEVNVSFGNKRLCERWLDNLFMVLYEDLRVFTFWRTEAAHYRTQKTVYRKTGTEWELLGDLALRLWHEVSSIVRLMKKILLTFPCIE
jgi:hypothetical protein